MLDRILLVEPRGFCAGVEMAIKALALMVLRCGPPVYCVHDIVHNDRVVARFRRLGVHFVDRVEQLPDGVPVLLSAHAAFFLPEVLSSSLFPWQPVW